MSEKTPVILVTGGAGFIGSNLVGHFADSADVVVCDRLGQDDRWKNIARADIADLIAAEQIFDFLVANRRGIDVVLHMGAISSTTETDVDLIVRNNFMLSRDLYRWCAEHGARYIYASSAATYGGGEAGFADDESLEALSRLRPLNAYGWSKHLFDRWVQHSLRRGDPRPSQWVGLKFFNVYGPNEDHKGSMKSVVRQIAPRVKAHEAVRLFRSHNPEFEDGGQKRDFIYVADCVRVIDWLYRDEGVNGLFNVGTGKARTFADLAGAVFDALGLPRRIEYVDTPIEIRDRYQYFTQAEMGKLERSGYSEGFTTLEEGVKEYVRQMDLG